MNQQVRRAGRRKGAGRQGRIEARQAAGPSRAIWPGIQGGKFQPLSAADMDKVHSAALSILETTGIGDPIDELLDIVLPKGAFLNDHGRLCFPRALMEDLIGGAANEYYVHARGSRAGRNQGAGLGLPISRAIMRAMSGDLTIEFNPDGTSFFRIRIPRHGAMARV